MKDLKILKPSELRKIVCVVVGTRPGIIKFSPIIREFTLRRIAFFVIHTGQHYSYEMDGTFFNDLSLPEPKYKLENVKTCKYHGEQTAEMLRGVEKALLKEKPILTLVGGDANTNLAGALAARKLGVNVGHVEAGLRSNDWRMPEEHNRVMIDHISDYLFAPTEESKLNLIRDGVKGKIYVTGNPIVDATRQNIKIAKEKSGIVSRLGLKEGSYLVATIHREENVDEPRSLKLMLEALNLVATKLSLPVVFPIHPRTEERLKFFGFKLPNGVLPTEPLSYLDFLCLMDCARLILTDSGGIQEETCILGKPCVTLRESTERSETLRVGSNIVAGLEPASVLHATRMMIDKNGDWPNPFGENAAKTIVDIVSDILTK